MASVSLVEHQGKRLLARAGILVPDGRLIQSAEDCATAFDDLGGDVVLKAQVPSGRRAKRGGVVRIGSRERARAEFSRLMATFEADVLAERYVPHANEAYVAVDARGPRVRFIASPDGGVDVEDHRSDVVACDVTNISMGPSPTVVAALTTALDGLGGSAPDLLGRMWTLVTEFDALLVEINPLTQGTEGRPLALDAKVVLDGYAAGRHRDGPRAWDVDLVSGPTDPIDYIELDGQVGVVGLGAGLSLYLADRLAQRGAGCAYIYDFTRAAVEEWAAIFERRASARLIQVIAEGLQKRPETTRAVLVNLTSGGTPVDGLVLSALAATAVAKVPIAFHVAGNSMSTARSLLDMARVPHALDIEGSIDLALRLAR